VARAPDGSCRRRCRGKAQADRQSGTLKQLTLAEFITTGAYDRHLRRSRLTYRRRRDRLGTGTTPRWS